MDLLSLKLSFLCPNLSNQSVTTCSANLHYSVALDQPARSFQISVCGSLEIQDPPQAEYILSTHLDTWHVVFLVPVLWGMHDYYVVHAVSPSSVSAQILVTVTPSFCEQALKAWKFFLSLQTQHSRVKES